MGESVQYIERNMIFSGKANCFYDIISLLETDHSFIAMSTCSEYAQINGCIINWGTNGDYDCYSLYLSNNNCIHIYLAASDYWRYSILSMGSGLVEIFRGNHVLYTIKVQNCDSNDKVLDSKTA